MGFRMPAPDPDAARNVALLVAALLGVAVVAVWARARVRSTLAAHRWARAALGATAVGAALAASLVIAAVTARWVFAQDCAGWSRRAQELMDLLGTRCYFFI